MILRGIRGAITVQKNEKKEIVEATKELLEKIISENSIEVENVASVIFTVTEDLNAEFPAVAARTIGWLDTPLLCTREINVPGSLPRCIRVLLHVNTDKKAADINHIYLKEAKILRR
ncbi:MAG: chorismate mutase [Candidatus Margulisiibacteriota bacterium]